LVYDPRAWSEGRGMSEIPTYSNEELRKLVAARLNEVVDPCSIAAGAPAGLADMGLVSSVQIERGSNGSIRLVVKVGVTHPFCMMAAVFLNEAKTRVSAIPGVDEVEVSLEGDLLWTPKLMSSEYKERLEKVRQGRLALPVKQ